MCNVCVSHVCACVHTCAWGGRAGWEGRGGLAGQTITMFECNLEGSVH